MSREDRARRIQETMHTPGWHDIAAILDAEAKEPEDELYEIMAKKPDSLTGKTALKYAIKAKALRDFKAILIDEVRILPENSNGAHNP